MLPMNCINNGKKNKFQQFTGRKTPARTGTKIKTAWSEEVTIISVLLFFTARTESAVGSEKKSRNRFIHFLITGITTYVGTCRADEAENDGSQASREPEQQEEHNVPGPGVAKLKHKMDISKN